MASLRHTVPIRRGPVDSTFFQNPARDPVAACQARRSCRLHAIAVPLQALPRNRCLASPPSTGGDASPLTSARSDARNDPFKRRRCFLSLDSGIRHSLYKGILRDFSCFWKPGMLSENLHFTPSIGQRQPTNRFQKRQRQDPGNLQRFFLWTFPGLAHDGGSRLLGAICAGQTCTGLQCLGASRDPLSNFRNTRGADRAGWPFGSDPLRPMPERGASHRPRLAGRFGAHNHAWYLPCRKAPPLRAGSFT